MQARWLLLCWHVGIALSYTDGLALGGFGFVLPWHFCNTF